MNGPEAVVQPSRFGAVDKVSDDVEGLRVMHFGIDDIGNGFVIEVNL